MRFEERQAQDVCHARAALETNRRERKLQAANGIAREICERRCSELAGAGVARLRACMAPLNEREERDRGDDRQRNR